MLQFVRGKPCSLRELLLLQADSSGENSGFVLEYNVITMCVLQMNPCLSRRICNILQDESTAFTRRIRLEQ